MFLALKELKYAKFRYVMMTTIIILIAWLVFILSGLGNGLATLSAATLKNIDAEYVVYEETAGATFAKSILSENLQDDLEKQKNVDKVAAFGASTIAVGKTKSKDADSKEDVAFLGVEPDAFFMPEVIEGEKLSYDNKKGVVINDTLKEAGYKIGDILLVANSDMKLEVVGYVKGETYNHLPAIFTVLENWRDYQYAAPGSDNDTDKAVQAFFLKAPNLEDPSTIDKAVKDVETVTKKTAINGMPGYKEENGTIMMMLAFCIVISAFIIAVFFYVITMQKTQQFGVMKAIGASNGFIGKAIVAQVAILSVLGIVIGIVFTYLTAKILPEGMPFDLDPTLIITYAIVLLIIALLSSIVSVLQIVKIDPLTALGRVE